MNNNNRAKFVAIINSDGKFGAHIEGYERDVINLLYEAIIKICEQYEHDPLDIIFAYKAANAINRGFIKNCQIKNMTPFDAYKWMQEVGNFHGSEYLIEGLEKVQAERKEQDEELSKSLKKCEQILKEIMDENKKKGEENNVS